MRSLNYGTILFGGAQIWITERHQVLGTRLENCEQNIGVTLSTSDFPTSVSAPENDDGPLKYLTI